MLEGTLGGAGVGFAMGGPIGAAVGAAAGLGIGVGEMLAVSRSAQPGEALGEPALPLASNN